MTVLSFNHVGINVADIDAGVDWYGRVLGCRLVMGPFDVRADDGGHGGRQAADVLGPEFGHMRQAHMATADGIGIELFQFVEPPHERREPALDIRRSGVFHVCFTAEDIEATTKLVVENGGRQRSQIWLNQPPHPKKRMVYLEDPWGTIIELYTHRYEVMYEG